jgi:hypothetical protein
LLAASLPLPARYAITIAITDDTKIPDEALVDDADAADAICPSSIDSSDAAGIGSGVSVDDGARCGVRRGARDCTRSHGSPSACVAQIRCEVHAHRRAHRHAYTNTPPAHTCLAVGRSDGSPCSRRAMNRFASTDTTFHSYRTPRHVQTAHTISTNTRNTHLLIEAVVDGQYFLKQVRLAAIVVVEGRVAGQCYVSA